MKFISLLSVASFAMSALALDAVKVPKYIASGDCDTEAKIEGSRWINRRLKIYIVNAQDPSTSYMIRKGFSWRPKFPITHFKYGVDEGDYKPGDYTALGVVGMFSKDNYVNHDEMVKVVPCPEYEQLSEDDQEAQIELTKVEQ